MRKPTTPCKPAKKAGKPSPALPVAKRIGRPPGLPSKRKSAWLQIRVTSAQHDVFKNKAKARGVSLSTLVVDMLTRL